MNCHTKKEGSGKAKVCFHGGICCPGRLIFKRGIRNRLVLYEITEKGQAKNKPMLGVVRFIGFLFLWRALPRARPQTKILGETILRYRTQAGLSQEKLAEKADLHPVYIGKIERG